MRRLRVLPGGSLREPQVESRAATHHRLDPDFSSVRFHDSPRKRQTDAVAGNILSVQPVENLENLASVLRFNTDSIVFHGKQESIGLRPAPKYE